MRRGFYSKMAIGNLNKNRRFYIPYMLSGAGLLAAFFIIRTLALDERLAEVKGGSVLPTIMGLGSAVMAILSVIMLLYTNSFLMKQRTKEYGLYQVLGMEKRHVVRILFFETLFSTMLILVTGLVSGIVFYKLCTLLICKLLKVESILGIYYISNGSLFQSASLFVAVYGLCFAWNIVRVGRMKPIEQLRAQHTGEKEPKVKLILLVIGIGTLFAGYYIALTTMNPLKAMVLFFVAVVLVIIGTYCLFVTGTIAVLKILKKNQHYYYKPRHMVAISGLLYRMKQNAVGLASITILACGVLVMLSTTVSLYAGVEDSISRMYPQDMYVSASARPASDDPEMDFEEEIPLEDDVIESLVNEFARNHNLTIDGFMHQNYLEVAYSFQNGEFCTDLTSSDQDSAVDVVFITNQEYEKMTGMSLNLKEHHMAVCRLDQGSYGLGKEVKVAGTIYTMENTLESFPVATPVSMVVDTYGIVVPDQEALNQIYEQQHTEYAFASEYSRRTAIKFAKGTELEKTAAEICKELYDMFFDYIREQYGDEAGAHLYVDSRWDMKENMLGLYGSLLFLGILLGLVFLFATAMIIYYKQISEGYEDRDRFQIMTKIGMSSQEVKKTISTQILLVFFLPLLVAAVHIAMAFPMITRVLKVLYLNNIALFMGCTIGCFAAFAVIYVIIYVLTARVYYRIVH